ncbi:hypothetical protein [Streptacidiphilus sp. EB103A]|uniref:hypothetical protein n=1 Tax=Streptacidiphilus sp. EB103A TaxID=3156275 RepID=UPI0035132621
MSTNTQQDATYNAAFDADAREVTVIRDVRGGISGPVGDYPAATLDEAVRVLFDLGYTPCGPWTPYSYGRIVSARLSPMH